MLVCLSNYSDERGYCYPSIAALERDTSQDRKTVIANLRSLCDAGLLKDTGRRVGVTKGVIVYQIIGIPESCSTHYVYKLTRYETGEFYLGKRSCIGDPEADSYRGSGKWTKDMAAQGVSLHREVLGVFETSEAALAEEQRLFRTFDSDPLCMNEGLPSKMRERNSSRNGTGSEIGTVPKSHVSSPVFPPKQYQNSQEAVPKTVHRTIREPSSEPSRNRQRGAARPPPRRRCPKDFEVTQELRDWAQQKTPDVDVDFETEGFRDWEFKSARTDWPATWRGWMRRAQVERPTKKNGAAKAPIKLKTAEEWEAIERERGESHVAN